MKKLFRKDIIIGGLIISLAASAIVVTTIVCFTGMVTK